MSARAVGTTKLGTPCSPRWSEDWVAVVESVEAELGRRVCGAELPEGHACELAGEGDSGRCRFHGGCSDSHAGRGNLNAMRHALYSRRLRSCSTLCPHWQRCPMAGEDVQKLDDEVRPECVFEMSEYESTLGEIAELLGDDASSAAVPKKVSQKVRFLRMMALRAAESFAMSRVMVQRAGDLLQCEDIVRAGNKVTTKGKHIEMRVSPTTEAYIKLDREQRLWHKRVSESARAYFEAVEAELRIVNCELRNGDAELKEVGAGSGAGGVGDGGSENGTQTMHELAREHARETGAFARVSGKALAPVKALVTPAVGVVAKPKDALKRSEFLVGLNAAPAGAKKDAAQKDVARAGKAANILEAHAERMLKGGSRK